MANILLLTLGTDGDVRPFLLLGSALKARGHAVTLLTHGSYADRARRAGLNFVALDQPEDRRSSSIAPFEPNTAQGMVALIQQYLIPAAPEHVAKIQACAGPGDTVLIANHTASLAAELAAEHLKLLHLPVFFSPLQLGTLPMLRAVLHSTVGDEVNRVRAQLGLTPVDDWDNHWRYPVGGLALWPDWFAASETDEMPGIVPIGFLVDPGTMQEIPAAAQAFLANDARPVLITGGTGVFVGPEFYTASVAACRQIGLSSLVVTRHPEILNGFREEMNWFESLPFGSVMPRLSAVIHHGGIGTAAQALAAGIPQVVLAVGVDRPDNAARLQRLGVGRFLPPPRWERGAIAEALQRLTTSLTVQKQCREFADRLHESDAANAACAWIERRVAEGVIQNYVVPQPKNEPPLRRETDTRTELVLRNLAGLSPARLELLTRSLKPKKPAPRADSIPPLSRTGASDSFPLSFAQQRLWFLDQWEPGSATYNVACAFRLSGRLDRDALERSLSEIVRRHEVLRTRFPSAGETPVQVIDPPTSVRLEVADLRVLPEADREAEALELAREALRKPFDLARGPLLRVKLLVLNESVHLVVLILHHIICDVWSVGVLVREFGQLYPAYSAGKASPLPEPMLQYADFAHWQRQHLQGERLEEQVDYWRQQLAGAATVLELPTDRPRPARQTEHGGTYVFTLAADLQRALQALSQQTGASLFMTLLAAFQTLLYRYTGQPDIIVGSPIANRHRVELEGIIGFFINTLALRADLREAGNPTFLELLKRVKEVCLGAYAHQDVPFEKLVEALQLERQLTRSPLFQVMLVLQNTPRQTLELPNLILTPLDIDVEASKFDLTLYLIETERGLSGKFEYNADLFDAATIERLAEHWRILLEGIVADPQQRLAELPMLSDMERQQLLVDWNATQVAYPEGHCLHHLFETQVERTPNAVAVVVGAKHSPKDSSSETRIVEANASPLRITYRELNERANHLAHYLRSLGVGPETLVALYLERSLDMIVGLLGILKAGGAYVPIDPAYPAERVAVILEDSQAAVVVTQSQLRTKDGGPLRETEDGEPRTIYLDTDWPAIEQSAIPLRYAPGTIVSNPQSAINPYNLAYLIYTSGSTGRPKGVALTHRSAVVFIQWAQQVFPREVLSGVLAATSLCFDLSIFELFVPLSQGGTVILVENALAIPADSEPPITLVNTVPSAMTELVRQGRVPSSVQVVNLAGEALRRKLVQQLYALPTVEQVYNLYGPSEDTTYSTFTLIDRDDPREPTIGHPIANTQAYILDAHLQPVPIGVIGELYLGGDGLARGYLGRPDLTAEKFIPNPFLKKDEGGRMKDESEKPFILPPSSFILYKTGDLARYLPTGAIEFLGRMDHQVKVRGYRIELGEIEAVLGQHPAVRECVVIAREVAERESQQLIAYLVVNESPPTPTGLRQFLKTRLPEYMVPAFFVLLDALPLTPNGKVDRRALPAPEGARPELHSTYVAPRNPTEEILVSIWMEVLNLKRLGVKDNFFELGGHSLLATRVISRMRQVFQVELPLRAIFEAPTVAGLADYLQTGGAAASSIQATPRAGAENWPLSFAQQRLWFLDQLEPGSAAYNLPAALRLTGTLDVLALRHSLTEIVRRHEALRTRFVAVSGQPLSVIDPVGDLSVPVIDLRWLSEPVRETSTKHLVAEEAGRPFDLTRGPMLRACLIQRADNEHVLLLTVHHIVADGWSIGVFVKELGTLYVAQVQGQSLLSAVEGLPQLPIQYADYAVWQQQWLQGGVLEQQVAYWQERLANVPPLELPTDHPRPTVQSYRGGLVSFELSPALTASLSALGQQTGTTLFMVLLAAFGVLLHRQSSQTDITVGTPIANRNRVELEGLIGFFVNTLVLRVDLREAGNPTFLELLKRVKEVCLGAYAHQDMPFEKLVDALQPERQLARSPLFQVMLVLQNTPRQKLELPHLTLAPLEIESTTAKFDLTLYLLEVEGGLSGKFEYNADLFDAATIARMADHLRILLAGIVADPQQRLAALPWLSDAERQLLLLEWNATQADYPRDLCLHHLFEAQAERTPEATAVVFENQRLTYRELNQRANHLAHYLHGLGVGPETLVALYLERSLDLIVGLLGILKAGGAYVPIDPAYPAARVQAILEDSQASVLLTQSHLLPTPNSSQLPEAELEDHLPRDPSTLRQAAPREVRGAGGSGSGADDSGHGVWRSEWGDGQPPNPELLVTLCLDTKWGSINPKGTFGQPSAVSNLPSTITPSNLAYVLYTSGSTGRPKGVQISHRALVNFLYSVQREPGLTRADVLLSVTTVAFDIFGLELYLPLITGARVEIASRETAMDGALLRQQLRTSGATVMQATPATWRLLLDTVEEESDASRLDLSGLKILCGGEALPRSLADRLLATGGELWNLYGPTETTIWSSVQKIDSTSAPIVIGQPLANTQFYILDPHGQPAPIGVIGELHIGGDGLARGYLGRPELTAEKFVPNPFLEKDEGGRMKDESKSPFILHPSSLILYKTGDLARYLPNGTIEFLGRVDHQVKVRGFRIELGEIEAVLGQHPAVRECVVMAREVAERESQQLIAYLVAQAPPPTTTDLRQFLQTRLPDYMVPAFFVLLDSLPLTPNGKVDRRALSTLSHLPRELRGVQRVEGSKGPEGSRLDLQAAYVAPRNPTEAALAQIWAELLNLEPVGIHDNFFELGGDSLLVLRVVARAKEAGYHLIPRQLFQHQTIAGLAGVIEIKATAQLAPEVMTGPVPFILGSLWFFRVNPPPPYQWNLSALMEIDDRLNPDVMRQAVRCVVRQHDALNLRFARDAAGWHASIVEPDETPPFTYSDFSGLSPVEQRAAIEAAAAELQTRVNIIEGPLLQVAYMDLGLERPGRLLILLHHLAADAFSQRIVLEDLQTAYQQLSQGQPVNLPAKTTTFKHWSERLSGYARSAEALQQLDYWLSRPWERVARLPLDHAAPPEANHLGSVRSAQAALTADETERLLRQTPQAYGAQLMEVLLTAMAQTLVQWTGVPAVLVEVMNHGRETSLEHVDLSRTVGWLAIGYPALLELPESAKPAAALLSVREQLRQLPALPNVGIGYQLLRDMRGDPALTEQLWALPQPEVVFNYLGQLDQGVSRASPIRPAAESPGSGGHPQRVRQRLLEFVIWIAGGRLILSIDYSENLHCPATVEGLANNFIGALRAMLTEARIELKTPVVSDGTD